MKKVFRVETENNRFCNSNLQYNVFAETSAEAISKIQNVIKVANFKDEKIIEAKLFCEVKEDKDLEEYMKEREEDEKMGNKQRGSKR